MAKPDVVETEGDSKSWRGSPAWTLIDMRMKGNFEKWLAEKHNSGRSLRQIALEIEQETGILVSHEIVRQWLQRTKEQTNGNRS